MLGGACTRAQVGEEKRARLRPVLRCLRTQTLDSDHLCGCGWDGKARARDERAGEETGMRRIASQVRKRELTSGFVDGDVVVVVLEEFSEINELSEVGEAEEELRGFDEAVCGSEAAASSNSFRCL